MGKVVLATGFWTAAPVAAKGMLGGISLVCALLIDVGVKPEVPAPPPWTRLSKLLNFETSELPDDPFAVPTPDLPLYA